MLLMQLSYDARRAQQLWLEEQGFTQKEAQQLVFLRWLKEQGRLES